MPFGFPSEKRSASPESPAIGLAASKRDGGGAWPLETRYPGVMPVEMDEGEGQPSRWNAPRPTRIEPVFGRVAMLAVLAANGRSTTASA